MTVLLRHIPAVLALLLLVSAARPVAAQPAGQTPAELEGVGVDEHLGTQLPLDLTFHDADGRTVRLGDYFDGTRPVLLNMVYHECPMLCSLLLDATAAALRQMDADMGWRPGEQFDVVTVSFDPDETPAMAAARKAHYREALPTPAAADAGWHFLTGDAQAIETLTEALGFRYRYLPDEDEYAHPAVLAFAGGTGTITRYLYGLEYPPRTVRTALVEASEGKVGTTIDRVILYCFQYDPDANSYVPIASNMMKLGGLLTLVVLGLGLFILWRREGRRSRAMEVPHGARLGEAGG